MALTAICDECGATETVFTDRLVPFHWWTLTQERPRLQGGDVSCLCSLQCIIAWASRTAVGRVHATRAEAIAADRATCEDVRFAERVEPAADGTPRWKLVDPKA